MIVVIITNIKPSILSKIPPCPGRIFPVSLIFSFLLKYEIIKSPTCAIIENIIDKKKYLTSKKFKGKVCGRILLTNIKEPKENINEPKTPENVFLGLILVNFFHLNILPKVYPPTSEQMQRIITHKSSANVISPPSVRKYIEYKDRINTKSRNNIIGLLLNVDKSSKVPKKNMKKRNDNNMYPPCIKKKKDKGSIIIDVNILF